MAPRPEATEWASPRRVRITEFSDPRVLPGDDGADRPHTRRGPLSALRAPRARRRGRGSWRTGKAASVMAVSIFFTHSSRDHASRQLVAAVAGYVWRRSGRRHPARIAIESLIVTAHPCTPRPGWKRWYASTEPAGHRGEGSVSIAGRSYARCLVLYGTRHKPEVQSTTT